MRKKTEEPVRITTATRPRSQDIAARQRRYLFSMSIRTVCFILAIVFRNTGLWPYFIAGAIVLPYVAVVLANAGASPDPVRRLEDRDAVAAAVENLLLAATAAGLASHWASVPPELHPAVRSVAGVGDDHQLVALVYLGWPTAEVPAPPRPLPQVAWVRR